MIDIQQLKDEWTQAGHSEPIPARLKDQFASRLMYEDAPPGSPWIRDRLVELVEHEELRQVLAGLRAFTPASIAANLDGLKKVTENFLNSQLATLQAQQAARDAEFAKLQNEEFSEIKKLIADQLKSQAEQQQAFLTAFRNDAATTIKHLQHAAANAESSISDDLMAALAKNRKTSYFNLVAAAFTAIGVVVFCWMFTDKLLGNL
jgi:ethanolamine ammonia-lyase small subunit